jgi:hypothetical protein
MRSAILAAVLLLITAPNIIAQEYKDAEAQKADLVWAQVSKIKPKQKIKVHLQNGEILKGAFVRSDEFGILLRIKKDESIQISREEIITIKLRSRAKGAGIGLLVGAGIGATLGATMPSEHFSRGGSIAASALGQGLIGALIGFAVASERTIHLKPR